MFISPFYLRCLFCLRGHLPCSEPPSTSSSPSRSTPHAPLEMSPERTSLPFQRYSQKALGVGENHFSLLHPPADVYNQQTHARSCTVCSPPQALVQPKRTSIAIADFSASSHLQRPTVPAVNIHFFQLRTGRLQACHLQHIVNILVIGRASILVTVVNAGCL